MLGGRQVVVLMKEDFGAFTYVTRLYELLCFVDRAFLYNLVNRANLVHIFFLLALQPPSGVVFYSSLAGFSLLAYEVS